MRRTPFMQPACQGDILLAVIDNLVVAPFSPPGNGLQATSTFTFAKCRGATVFEARSKTCCGFQVEHKVDVGQGAKIERHVGLQDAKIEAARIEPDNAISATQFLGQSEDFVFPKNAEFTISRRKSHANRKAKLFDIAPASDFIGGSFGLKVKIDEVHKYLAAHSLSTKVQ
jgi:hypothetical protein